MEKRSSIIDRLRTKDCVVALADGCMDSPGYCALYCTYTTLENDSRDDIISVVNIDKRAQRNSVIMEKEVFIRTID
ncbi:hypothetical protein J4Q44_G00139840 [Coregonus suidteri]|uniref:Uncharacterized protein n=1 Tax=Coregonus suidteri TaxID=861788 RepID=A0AAN8QTX2_9TELE